MCILLLPGAYSQTPTLRNLLSTYYYESGKLLECVDVCWYSHRTPSVYLMVGMIRAESSVSLSTCAEFVM